MPHAVGWYCIPDDVSVQVLACRITEACEDVLVYYANLMIASK